MIISNISFYEENVKGFRKVIYVFNLRIKIFNGIKKLRYKYLVKLQVVESRREKNFQVIERCLRNK